MTMYRKVTSASGKAKSSMKGGGYQGRLASLRDKLFRTILKDKLVLVQKEFHLEHSFYRECIKLGHYDIELESDCNLYLRRSDTFDINKIKFIFDRFETGSFTKDSVRPKRLPPQYGGK